MACGGEVLELLNCVRSGHGSKDLRAAGGPRRVKAVCCAGSRAEGPRKALSMSACSWMAAAFLWVD